MCHVSCVTCHVSRVMCHLSPVTIFFTYFFSITKKYIYIYILQKKIYKVVELVGGGSVIYRLVFNPSLITTVFEKQPLASPGLLIT